MDKKGDRSIFADRRFWLVLIVAAAVRVVYLIIYSNLPDWSFLTVDNYYHHNLAQSIAAGNIVGDTTYFRAPFYVYILGLLYSLAGSSLWVARIFGVAVGLTSVAVTGILGQRIYSRHIGIWAAAIHALYPMAVFFEAELLLDPLFTLLLQIAVLQWFRWQDSPRPNAALVAGLFFGLAAITRPTALPIAAVAVLFMVLPSRRSIASAAALIAGVAIVVTPIFIRNVAMAHDPVVISSQGGINLYIGNNEVADGLSARLPEPMGYNWRIKQVSYRAEQALGTQLKPGEVSDYWTGRALEWISDNPLGFVSLYLKKLYYALSDREISNNRELGNFFARVWILGFNPLSFAFLLGFAALAVVEGLRRGSVEVRFVLVSLAVYLAVMSLFFFTSRFRLPLLPFFIILAVAGAHRAIQIFTRERTRSGFFLIAIAMLVWAGSFFHMVKLPPGAPVTGHLSEGLHYYNTGDIDRALDQFRIAAGADATFPEVNLNLGACHLRLGRTDSAAYYFDREVTLHPQRPKAYVNLGSLALVAGNAREASARAEEALELAPWDITANILNLRALSRVGDIDDAGFTAAVEHAGDRTDGDLYLLNEAAILLSNRGQLTAAEKILADAMKSRPPAIETDDEMFTLAPRHAAPQRRKELARSHYQLGYLAGLTGRFYMAVEESGQAILMDSSLADAYVNLISGLWSIGRTTEADSVLATARERFPDHANLQRLQEFRHK